MNDVIMRALVKGVSDWITAVFQTAAKKGLLILFLSGLSIGGGLEIIHLLAQAERMRGEFKLEIKAELAQARNEYREEITQLKHRLSVCEDERVNLKIRVATLEAKLKK